MLNQAQNCIISLDMFGMYLTFSELGSRKHKTLIGALFSLLAMLIILVFSILLGKELFSKESTYMFTSQSLFDPQTTQTNFKFFPLIITLVKGHSNADYRVSINQPSFNLTIMECNPKDFILEYQTLMQETLEDFAKQGVIPYCVNQGLIPNSIKFNLNYVSNENLSNNSYFLTNNENNNKNVNNSKVNSINIYLVNVLANTKDYKHPLIYYLEHSTATLANVIDGKFVVDIGVFEVFTDQGNFFESYSQSMFFAINNILSTPQYFGFEIVPANEFPSTADLGFEISFTFAKFKTSIYRKYPKIQEFLADVTGVFWIINSLINCLISDFVKFNFLVNYSFSGEGKDNKINNNDSNSPSSFRFKTSILNNNYNNNSNLNCKKSSFCEEVLEERRSERFHSQSQNNNNIVTISNSENSKLPCFDRSINDVNQYLTTNKPLSHERFNNRLMFEKRSMLLPSNKKETHGHKGCNKEKHKNKDISIKDLIVCSDSLKMPVSRATEDKQNSSNKSMFAMQSGKKGFLPNNDSRKFNNSKAEDYNGLINNVNNFNNSNFSNKNLRQFSEDFFLNNIISENMKFSSKQSKERINDEKHFDEYENTDCLHEKEYINKKFNKNINKEGKENFGLNFNQNNDNPCNKYKSTEGMEKLHCNENLRPVKSYSDVININNFPELSLEKKFFSIPDNINDDLAKINSNNKEIIIEVNNKQQIFNSFKNFSNKQCEQQEQKNDHILNNNYVYDINNGQFPNTNSTKSEMLIASRDKNNHNNANLIQKNTCCFSLLNESNNEKQAFIKTKLATTHFDYFNGSQIKSLVEGKHNDLNNFDYVYFLLERILCCQLFMRSKLIYHILEKMESQFDFTTYLKLLNKNKQ